MAQHPEPCEICERIAQIERGEHPGFIAELPSGYAVLGDSQFFRGYCLLLCRQPVADLEELDAEFRTQFLADMARLSAAVSSAIRPHKINLESLGNVVPHLHWHVFPRQLSEEHPTQPVWLHIPATPNDEFALDATRDAQLIEDLRAALS